MIGTKHFELADLKRIPVEVSPAAQTLIDRSSDEGRKFPLALSEILGASGTIASVHIDVAPVRQHFPLHPTADTEAMLLSITAKHTGNQPDHRWLLYATTLCDQPRGPHHPGFRAHQAAFDVLHTYPHTQQQQEA